jgi:hypothetical protein
MDGPPEPRRHVTLTDGRTLIVRPATPADIDGVSALYQQLDPEDRHRRFFSAFQPPHAFLERLTTAADRGGVELVAAVSGDDPPEQVVGEAGYALLPNGDGELGITVAEPWRGWLGPYLLDALLEAAAAEGVPNLEADVLLANGPMLTLARARGCVSMGHPDWGVVRVIMGTTGPTPTWPGQHERPRVLIEGAGGRWHAEEEATAAGLDVLACAGPAGRRQRCPALTGQPCPLAADADAIVVANRPDHPDWHALLAAHHDLHPGVPVCVELAGDAAAPDNLPQVPAGADAATVVAFVQRFARSEQPEHGTTIP